MKETFCEVCKSVHPPAHRDNRVCYWKSPQVFELVAKVYDPPPPKKPKTPAPSLQPPQ